MDFDITTEKNVTIHFKEPISLDEVLFEIINKNPNILLSCSRNLDNEQTLYFDNIGTKTLLEYFSENVFSAVELQQMLLDMIQTLKILLEHGFKENTIILDPSYIFISVYDKRPKFLCLPISDTNQTTDIQNPKTTSNGLAEFFKKIIYNVKTNNSYSLIGLVLEETSKKKFSISRFETQVENYTDITVKDVDRGYNKAALLGLLLPIITGLIAAILMWIGFKNAMQYYIEFDIIAYLSIAISSIINAIIGGLISQKPKGKATVERKEIKYNFTNAELENIKEEQQAKEEAEQRVRERKIEHIDLNTAIANAVIKSGVISFNFSRSMNDIGSDRTPPVSVQRSQPLPNPVRPDNNRNIGSVDMAETNVRTSANQNPNMPERKEIAYVPQASVQAMGESVHGAPVINDGDRTNLLNFNNVPLPEKRYTQSIIPYLVSIKAPDKKIILSKEHFSVGSSDDCDLIIKVDTVSRHHAVINVSRIGCSVVDNSTNGTYINNVRIQKGVPTAVKNGDVISFNREQYRFLDR